MNDFKVNIVIDGAEYKANVKVDKKKMLLDYEGKNVSFSLKDVEAIKNENNNLMKIVVNKKIITFKGDSVIKINNFFNNFKTYNESNIKVKPVSYESIKKPRNICILNTILFAFIYRGLKGASLAELWGTSKISAAIGAILGGTEEYYPNDMLETMIFILLACEVIYSLIVIFKNRSQAVSLLQNSNNSTNHEEIVSESYNIETLNKLKELLDDGVITQDDFERKKDEILKKI